MQRLLCAGLAEVPGAAAASHLNLIFNPVHISVGKENLLIYFS